MRSLAALSNSAEEGSGGAEQGRKITNQLVHEIRRLVNDVISSDEWSTLMADVAAGAVEVKQEGEALAAPGFGDNLEDANASAPAAKRSRLEDRLTHTVE